MSLTSQPLLALFADMIACPRYGPSSRANNTPPITANECWVFYQGVWYD
jgi:hypothetical protein